MFCIVIMIFSNSYLEGELNECMENSIKESEYCLSDLDKEKNSGYKLGIYESFYSCLKYVDKNTCEQIKNESEDKSRS